MRPGRDLSTAEDGCRRQERRLRLLRTIERDQRRRRVAAERHLTAASRVRSRQGAGQHIVGWVGQYSQTGSRRGVHQASGCAHVWILRAPSFTTAVIWCKNKVMPWARYSKDVKLRWYRHIIANCHDKPLQKVARRNVTGCGEICIYLVHVNCTYLAGICVRMWL